jgi:hypothetical protein
MTKLRIATSEDPELHVQGYGILKASQIRKKIQDYSNEIAARAAKGDWRSVGHFAYGNGVLKALIETISKHEDR